MIVEVTAFGHVVKNAVKVLSISRPFQVVKPVCAGRMNE